MSYNSNIIFLIRSGVINFHKDHNYMNNDSFSVTWLQTTLSNLGYDTLCIDGKYGPNTAAAVKCFQQDNGLKVDGIFGKQTLVKLEEIIGHPLDDDIPQANSPASTFTDCFTAKKDLPDYKYKQMRTTRVNTSDEAAALIARYPGEGTPLTVSEYLSNLDTLASIPSNTYDKQDCSGFTLAARNKQGYHGATTSLTQHSAYFGFIKDLGGYDALIPGMELHMGNRKSTSSNLFYSSHIGVYAGKHDFGDSNGPVHAVYQSSPSYPKLVKKYVKAKGSNGKPNGPNLTTMNNSWNYWAWSKYIRPDDPGDLTKHTKGEPNHETIFD